MNLSVQATNILTVLSFVPLVVLGFLIHKKISYQNFGSIMLGMIRLFLLCISYIFVYSLIMPW